MRRGDRRGSEPWENKQVEAGDVLRCQDRWARRLRGDGREEGKEL